ncbi:MAG: DUF4239 domain-containing protein [Verrucomicrobia bacterium]|nr:DUF4239 domain-containing protein [Verrucomicrobiota bacterium]
MTRLYQAELVCLAAFAGMCLTAYAGFYVARRSQKQDEPPTEIFSTVSGAVFALLGLLVAFTFHGAYSRYEHRRQLIRQEVDAIRTVAAYLDLLPAAAQPQLRTRLAVYAQSRTAYYVKLINPTEAVREKDRANTIQAELWREALAAVRAQADDVTGTLLLPAVNDLARIASERSVTIRAHIPATIWFFLLGVALVCAGLAGYRAGVAGRASKFYLVLFALVMAAVLYLILDIEYPRFGLINLDEANRNLEALAETLAR